MKRRVSRPLRLPAHSGRLLLSILLLLASACTREPAKRISFWAMGREGEVAQQLIPGFERKHPDVQVEVQQIPWSAAHEKLLTAFVGNALPDVFQLGNTWIPELVAIHAVAPLDTRLPIGERADFLSGFLAPNVIDDVLYAVPWYVDTRLLFYRSDILEKQGIQMPLRTWPQWLDAMQRVKQRDPQSYAILLPLNEWQPLVILALQAGADLLSDNARRAHFDSPEFRRALTLYVDLFHTGLAPRAGEAQLANLYQEFGGGRISFFVSGPWNIGELSRRLPAGDQARWANAALPSLDANYPGVSVTGGSSLALSSSSRNPELAWQLIEYLSAPAQQLELYRLTGDLPARASAWKQGELTDGERTRAFWTQFQRVQTTPKIPEWERIASKIMEHTEGVVRGERSPDEALSALDADVDLILEKRRILLDRGAAQ